MDPQMLYLQLGQAELVVLLRLLHAETLPGLGTEPLGNLREPEQSIALNSALDGLRARGVLHMDPLANKVQMDQVTFALIGSCLQARAMILISTVFPDGTTRVRYYYVTPNLTVEHSVPEIGLHQFVGVAKPFPMLGRMHKEMKLNGQSAVRATAPANLPGEVWEQAKELARQKNMTGVANILSTAGVPVLTADELLKTLANPKYSSSAVLVLLGKTGEPIRSETINGVAVVEGESGLWLITSANWKEFNLQIEQVAASKVKTQLENLVNTAATIQ